MNFLFDKKLFVMLKTINLKLNQFWRRVGEIMLCHEKKLGLLFLGPFALFFLYILVSDEPYLVMHFNSDDVKT